MQNQQGYPGFISHGSRLAAVEEPVKKIVAMSKHFQQVSSAGLDIFSKAMLYGVIFDFHEGVIYFRKNICHVLSPVKFIHFGAVRVPMYINDTDSGLELFRNFDQRIEDRKSTRLNSSHLVISYAVFCLKKK